MSDQLEIKKEEERCKDCDKVLADCICKTVVFKEGTVGATGTEDTIEPDDQAKKVVTINERYVVKRTIGVGGMGTVYEAQHIVLGNSVALKVLRSELVEEQSILKRFEQEARACASLSHPNLVSVYDCGITSDDQPFLVMEYLEGDHLLDELKSVDILKLEQFFEIFLQVVSGLEYAHSKGVIHRDLKPTNIIVAKGPKGISVPKIVDFGIAKIEDLGGNIQMLTQTGEVFGSPAYMSPEQCSGDQVDQRSDIYSLGCVMYETLSGKQAFPGHNMMTVLEKQLNEDPKAFHELPIDADVPNSLRDIVFKCLNKNPDDRYNSCSELHSELSKAKERLIGPSKFGPGQKKILVSVSLLVALLLVMILVTGNYKNLLPLSEEVSEVGSSGSVSESEVADLMFADFAASRLVLPDAIKAYENQLSKEDKKGKSFELKLSILANMLRLYSQTSRHKEGAELFSKYKAQIKEAEKIIKKDSIETSFCNNLVQVYEFAGYCNGQINNKFEAENQYLKAVRFSNELPVSDWIKVKLHIDYSAYLKDTLRRGKDSYKEASLAQDVILKMPEDRQAMFANLYMDTIRRQSWASWLDKDYPKTEHAIKRSIELTVNQAPDWHAREDFKNLVNVYNEQGKTKEAKSTKDQIEKVLRQTQKARNRMSKSDLGYRRFHLNSSLLWYKQGK